jgi:hypothetical protein
VPERPRTGLGGTADLVVARVLGQLGELVGGLGLPVGAGRVDDTMARSRLRRWATELNTSEAISSKASSRKSIAR